MRNSADISFLKTIWRKMKHVYWEMNHYGRKEILAKFREEGPTKPFTIISQNCIGGVIYNDLGMEFISPTINMFIEDENFVKLVENLEHYMVVKPKPLLECYVDPIDNKVRYPKILIDDIELCCLHYRNCGEAIDAWERRKKRIVWDNIFVIGNSWNLHGSIKLIERLCNTSYKMAIFVTDKIDFKECIRLPGDFWKLDQRGIIRPNITDFVPNSNYRYFEQFFDFISFLKQ